METIQLDLTINMRNTGPNGTHELYQSSIISPIVLVPDDTQVADGASISIAFPIDRKVQRRMQRGSS